MASQNTIYSDSNGQNKKGNKKVPQSWIEALKRSGEVPSQQQEEVKKMKEEKDDLETRHEKVQFHLNRVKKQEKEIYNRKQRETQEKIEELRKEVATLAKKSENLEKELEIAAQQPVIDPGKSDISFLEGLIKAIKRFREKIEDASIWLKAWNQKKQKKGAFWGKVNSKKGGAQFLLSSEHSAARSAG
jgi:chromosome segregation ATPase